MTAERWDEAKVMDRLSRLGLDPDRPLLEQLEEEGAKDEQISAWLEAKVYPNREIMSELDNLTLTRINASG